jgi:hypothetical protein
MLLETTLFCLVAPLGKELLLGGFLEFVIFLSSFQSQVLNAILSCCAAVGNKTKITQTPLLHIHNL